MRVFIVYAWIKFIVYASVLCICMEFICIQVFICVYHGSSLYVYASVYV